MGGGPNPTCRAMHDHRVIQKLTTGQLLIGDPCMPTRRKALAVGSQQRGRCSGQLTTTTTQNLQVESDDHRTHLSSRGCLEASDRCDRQMAPPRVPGSCCFLGRRGISQNCPDLPKDLNSGMVPKSYSSILLWTKEQSWIQIWMLTGFEAL